MPFGQILPYYRPQHVVVREPTPVYHENPWLGALRTLATRAAAAKISAMIQEGIKKRLLEQTLAGQLEQQKLKNVESIIEEQLKGRRKQADIEATLAQKGIIPAKMGQPSAFTVGGKPYAYSEELGNALSKKTTPSTYEALLVNMANKGILSPQQLEKKLIDYTAKKYSVSHKQGGKPKIKSYTDYLWHLASLGKISPLAAASGQVTYELATKRTSNRPLSPETQTFLYLTQTKGLSPLEAYKRIIELRSKSKQGQTAADIFGSVLDQGTGETTTSSEPEAIVDEFEKAKKRYGASGGW